MSPLYEEMQVRRHCEQIDERSIQIFMLMGSIADGAMFEAQRVLVYCESSTKGGGSALGCDCRSLNRSYIYQ
jgi:hypothetical protein